MEEIKCGFTKVVLLLPGIHEHTWKREYWLQGEEKAAPTQTQRQVSATTLQAPARESEEHTQELHHLREASWEVKQVYSCYCLSLKDCLVLKHDSDYTVKCF